MSPVLNSEHPAIAMFRGFVIRRICKTPAFPKGAMYSPIFAVELVPRRVSASSPVIAFIASTQRVIYMFTDIETPVERRAYKHNTAQSEDYPNQQGVLRHLGVQKDLQAVSPGLAKLRHLGGQPGLHGISPGLGGVTLPAASLSRRVRSR